MAGFTQVPVKISGKIDSKGRVTVPARIRNRLNLEKGDEISLTLESSEVIRKNFTSKKEALSFLSKLENVQSFNFNGTILEAVLDE